MNVEIITPMDGWVLERMARRIEKHLEGAVVKGKPTGTADVTYFCHYNEYEPVGTPTAALFTHLEPEGHPLYTRWFDVAGRVDGCVAMSRAHLKYLPRDKTRAIWPGVGSEFRPRKLRVGAAVNRNGDNDFRKGRDLLERLKREHSDWLEVVETQGKLPDEAMPDWYRSLDVYLVTSRYEGGPLTAAEALACGVPIVAPPVGFVPTLEDSGNVSLYPTGDYDGMVEMLSVHRKKRHFYSRVRTWDIWAKEHEELFKELAYEHIQTA